MFSHQPSKQIENVIVKTMETSPLKGYHLDMNTEYLQKYKNTKLDKIEKPKPEDTLKFNGPPQSITTYGHQFPGHRGSNQYVIIFLFRWSQPTNMRLGNLLLMVRQSIQWSLLWKKTARRKCWSIRIILEQDLIGMEMELLMEPISRLWILKKITWHIFHDSDQKSIKRCLMLLITLVKNLLSRYLLSARVPGKIVTSLSVKNPVAEISFSSFWEH